MKKADKDKFGIYICAIALLLVIAAGAMIMEACSYRNNGKDKPPVTQTPYITPEATESSTEKENRVENTPEPTPSPTVNPEKKVYTYLQGPKSWSERRAWSGEWGEAYYDGGSFGGFGCGLCCMANVYSTLSGYRCSPADMYRFAKKNTYYGGGGAIDWGYMRRALNKAGVSCGVKKKPKSYKAFRKDIASGKCSIVLVSSYNSRCYWKDTPGHYVTIFLYDKKTEKVFLADSGDPNHNRRWVSLKKIYKSLKTANNWQYLKVTGYKKKNDKWRHKKANGNWVMPEYLSD